MMNALPGYEIKRSKSSKRLLVSLIMAFPIIVWIVNLFS